MYKEGEQFMKKHLSTLLMPVLIIVLILSGCATTTQVKEIAPPSAVLAPTPVQEEVEPLQPVVEPIPTVEKAIPAVVEDVEQDISPTKEEKIIHLISTSDVHGTIFPYDFIQNKDLDYSLMSVSTYVNDMRKRGELVVLLDNGDVLQGQPLVYYYNFIKTEVPHIVSMVNNDMRYDVSSIGNHDIEAGPDVYMKVANESNYPYVGANIVDEITKEPLVNPYVMIERDGVKIAVLGLTTPGIPSWLPKNLYEGILFEDMVTTAKKWIPIIQENENPDVIVGLFHSGVSESPYDEDVSLYENASVYVAQQVEGFDVIFSGHDHKDTNMEVMSPSGKSVYIVGALNAARSVAQVTLKFEYDVNEDSYVLSSLSPETIMMDNIEPDTTLMEKYQDTIDEVTTWVSAEVGKISETISSRDSMFGDSAFVDLIHSIQLDITGADISISAPLSFDATIKEGSVYVRDMFSLYPYENLLYTVSLTGRELHDMAEYSYGAWFDQMSSLDDDLINFKKDADGNLIYSERYNSFEGVTRYYNYDSFSGINYVVDITKPAGSRVTIKTLSDGRTFSKDATYLVALNSYRAQGGGGHLEAAGLTKEMVDERLVSATDKDLRYYLLKEFENNEVISPYVDNNWLVIPNLWVRRGMKNSYPKLYGELLSE